MSPKTILRGFDRTFHSVGAAGLLRLGETMLSKRSRLFQKHRRSFVGKRALEIGGLSGVFGRNGFAPVYSLLADLTNCNFSSSTIWEGTISEGRTLRYDPSKSPGLQLVREATDLDGLPDRSFELVLSSHILEHVANPLRALEEWRRVLTDDGLLLLVLPHRDGTFDRLRPLTTVEHFLDHYRNETTEDDQTHVDEILRLHDGRLDPDAADRDAFARRVRDNTTWRSNHHHVFDCENALELLALAGFRVLAAEARLPFHIIALASASSTQGTHEENERAVILKRARTASPFFRDRRFI